MELKPIKEKKEALYPTVKEVPKSNFMKNIILSGTLTLDPSMLIEPQAIAIHSYIGPLKICRIARNATIIFAIISLLVLVINKFKIKKCMNETEKEAKLKKRIKTNWYFLTISTVIIVSLSGLIAFLKYNI